jgi:NAD(P)-dependent dehydrogenase (short-subunit alcohol dehydrogenase family)
MHNVGRVSEPDEQAAAIVFLASDAASNINGVVLPWTCSASTYRRACWPRPAGGIRTCASTKAP